MKKYLKYIIPVIILIALGLIIFFMTRDKVETKNLRDEYTSLPKDNLFVYRDSDEIIKILKNGTGIVFLGFPECKWCQAYVPILDEVAKEEGVEKIYYYNILEDRKENNKTYKEMVKLLKKYLDFDEEGNERIFVPEVAFVVKGLVVASDNETSLISGETTPEEYWTDSKKQETKERLRVYINQVLNEKCEECSV